MIVVKIELWPFGRYKDRREIGRAIIINDGTGDEKLGNYKVEFKHSGIYYGKDGNYKTGKVKGFSRSLSPYHLLARALKGAGIK